MKDVTDDKNYLKQQYKTTNNLQTRIRTHQLYDENPVDFPEWVLNHVSWQGTENVIDVGCGAGVYTESVQKKCRHYIAADFSLGMLQSINHPHRINLDVQRLPLLARSFDVVLANHMIYHIPNKKQGIAEIRRVLRSRGVLIAATNSAHTYQELGQLSKQVMAELDLPLPPTLARQETASFTLENGKSWLEPHFQHVQRFDLSGALVFPEPEPLLDYLGSMRARWDIPLAQIGKQWEDVQPTIRRIVQAHIDIHGSFRVGKLSGVFICRP